MKNKAHWQELLATLDRIEKQNRQVSFWLRDDDAFEPTPALSRLCELSLRFEIPLLLAVIPKNAELRLADYLQSFPLVSPALHGYSHRNFAPIGERAQELGLHRPLETVFAEISAGEIKLRNLFPDSFVPALVPPWNRMADDILPRLGKLGLQAVSRFGVSAPKLCGIRQINADIDIINWRKGRIGRPHEELVKTLIGLIENSEPSAPVGILAHHLAHDETAWSFLDDFSAVIEHHPAARWVTFRSLI